MNQERKRAGAGRWLLRQLPTLALPALALGGIGFVIYRHRADAVLEWQARLAVREAQTTARKSLMARGDLTRTLALCRAGWRDELHLHHEPVALAWTRSGLDAYFLEGSDRSTLRQVRCDAQGVSRGPRVEHPLHEHLPAEAPAGSGPAAEGERHLALDELSSRSFAPEELAVEFLADPLTGAVLSRRWRAGESGAQAILEPPNATPFDFLVASPRFRPNDDAAPPPLRPLPRHHWLAQVDAAFRLIERALPAGARIAELTLGEDKIQLTIESPTPAFDGKPPAPYGDKTFDEYGAAEMDWWYPREIPGFGCASGQPLARVRGAFIADRARFGAQPLAQAWYSCSPAFSDGRNGVWHLQAK